VNDVAIGQGRRFPAILAMITTVAVAIVAGLQADADIRTDVANRNSQYYAVLTSGELFRQGLRSDFDLGTAADSVKDALESNVLELTALEREDAGDSAGAGAVREQASLAAARASRLGSLSAVLTDPAYAPDSPGAAPDFAAYLDDSYKESNRLLGLQNAAADDYGRWNRKSDGYVAVLALMATSLFLFGLAQAASDRIRLPVSILGMVVFGGTLVWTATIFIG
jgi:hypothetical protein